MKKNILIPLVTLVAVIAASLLLILAANAVPRSAVRDNAVSTIERIADDDFQRIPKPVGSAMRLDPFTDCLMCNIVLSVNEDSIVRSAMLNPMHMHSVKTQINDTRQWALDGQWDGQLINYGRYWHGYQVPLTALLTVTDYRGIRVINAVIYLLLLVVALTLAWRRCSPAMAAALFIALTLTLSPIVAPMSMQYIGCHIIMLLGTIAALAIPKEKGDRFYVAASIFIVLGGLTAFIDFLTVPVITLGVPAAFYVARHGRDKRRLRLLLTLCLVWAVGYGATWSAKWLFAGLFTDVDILEDALQTARYRTTGKLPSGRGLSRGAIVAHLASFVTPMRVAVLAAVTAVAVALLRLIAGSWQRLRQHAWLLAVAALPLVWYAILLPHSYAHLFFTWRAIIVTIFALTAYIILSVIKSRPHDTTE